MHKFMKTLHSTGVEAPKMYETENDISLQRRTQLNALMNQRLASAVDLQMQMKQAHWNVKGPSFIGLHELFDKVSEAVEGYVDEIAERIVQLGGVAEGTVRMAASPAHFRLSARKPATQSAKPMNWKTPTRRICSPRFPAASTNGCGLSKPTPKPKNNDHEKAHHQVRSHRANASGPENCSSIPTGSRESHDCQAAEAGQHVLQIP